MIPVLSGVSSLSIDEGADVKLDAPAETAWNGTFSAMQTNLACLLPFRSYLPPWPGVSHGGALTLRRLRFEDQVAPRQGAVAANNGTMVVAGCAFVQCSSLGVGGALVNREGGLLLIQSAPPPLSSSSSPYDDDVGVRRESRFEGNRAVFGGALFNFNGASTCRTQSTPRSADF